MLSYHTSVILSWRFLLLRRCLCRCDIGIVLVSQPHQNASYIVSECSPPYNTNVAEGYMLSNVYQYSSTFLLMMMHMRDILKLKLKKRSFSRTPKLHWNQMLPLHNIVHFPSFLAIKSLCLISRESKPTLL